MVTIKIADRGWLCACVAMISEAAGKISKTSYAQVEYVPMPLSFVGVELLAMLAFSSFRTRVIVEVEGD
jgi:hypothetical protein